MKPTFINIPSVSDNTVNTLIKVGAGFVLLYMAKKYFEDKAETAADKNIATDAAAGQARALEAAMNPSGIRFLRETDGTNTEAIYEIGKQITNLAKVQEYYSAQTHGRKLHEDLTKEISAEGYDKFLALATKGTSGNPKYATVRSDVPARYWVLTTANANIRKSPKWQSPALPFNNIVKTAGQGIRIGLTTGKFVHDEQKDVVFIEFHTQNGSNPNKYFYWVAKSQVELMSGEELQKREKKGDKTLFEFVGPLSGIGNIKQQHVISITQLIVYDEQFKPLSSAAKNTIIGFPVMVLDTAKGSYIKVQTIQGRMRWVNKKDVRIENR